MPTYTIKDPTTGKTLKVRGDSPPTPDELESLFAPTPESDPNKGVVSPSEPDTFAGGFAKSLGDTALSTGKGIVEGVAQGLNPVNWVMGPYNTAKDLITNRGRGTIEGLKQVASGDPEAGGQAIGNLLLMHPKVMPVIPKVYQKTGAGIQKIAPLVGKATKYPAIGSAVGMNIPMSMALAMAEPATRLVGKGVEGFGNILSRGVSKLTDSPEPPPPMSSDIPAPKWNYDKFNVAKEGKVVENKPNWVEGEFTQDPPETGVVATGRSSGPVASPTSSMQEPKMLPAHEVTSYQPGPMDEVLGTAAPAQELGQPRVKSWKPGYGPSADDAKALRDKFGSKTTASLLATSQKQVKNLTGDVVPAVPSHVRARITEKMGTLSPEEQAAYLAQSQNNPRMSDFIRSLMK